MDWVRLALLGIVCFRLSQLIAYDVWPFNIMKSIRVFFGRRSSINPVYATIAEMLICPFCLGIWFAVALALLIPSESILDYFLNVMVIAGIQAFMEGLTLRQN